MAFVVRSQDFFSVEPKLRQIPILGEEVIDTDIVDIPQVTLLTESPDEICPRFPQSRVRVHKPVLVSSSGVRISCESGRVDTGDAYPVRGIFLCVFLGNT